MNKLYYIAGGLAFVSIAMWFFYGIAWLIHRFVLEEAEISSITCFHTAACLLFLAGVVWESAKGLHASDLKNTIDTTNNTPD